MGLFSKIYPQGVYQIHPYPIFPLFAYDDIYLWGNKVKTLNAYVSDNIQEVDAFPVEG